MFYKIAFLLVFLYIHKSPTIKKLQICQGMSPTGVPVHRRVFVNWWNVPLN